MVNPLETAGDALPEGVRATPHIVPHCAGGAEVDGFPAAQSSAVGLLGLSRRPPVDRDLHVSPTPTSTHRAEPKLDMNQ